jgi:hypothetical protein
MSLGAVCLAGRILRRLPCASRAHLGAHDLAAPDYLSRFRAHDRAITAMPRRTRNPRNLARSSAPQRSCLVKPPIIPAGICCNLWNRRGPPDVESITSDRSPPTLAGRQPASRLAAPATLPRAVLAERFDWRQFESSSLRGVGRWRFSGKSQNAPTAAPK